MSDRDALFRAILAAPDDDAPRLIYADYLQEQGEDERAEFIRVQCRMARIPAGTSLHQPLAVQSQHLERSHRHQWDGPFQPLCARVDHRRGFVETVQLTHLQFIEHGATLQQLAPIRLWAFRSYLLPRQYDHSAALHDVVRQPHFDVVRDVEISFYSPDELLAEIMESPYRASLQAITLNDTRVSGRQLQRFFEAVPTITEVTASSSNVRLVYPLWRKGAIHRLRRLELQRCKVTNEVLAGIAHAKALEQLESLWLDDNPCDDRGVLELMQSPYVRNLRELSLANIMVGNETAIQLAKSPILQNLRVLNLSGCGIDSSGCQALADSPFLEHLECLCLDQNRVSITVENELKSRFGVACVSIGW